MRFEMTTPIVWPDGGPIETFWRKALPLVYARNRCMAMASAQLIFHIIRFKIFAITTTWFNHSKIP
ncbi:MAG TPA: hypothetical protein DCM28_03615 [Phycisphaerales bacterium]|nr:hypothetical protein [Phycisphaerales bacterium]HCD34345.1 hypothetical protein [Phycisphaerales bacterium]